WLTGNAGFTPYPGMHTVGAHNKTSGQTAAIGEGDERAVGMPADRLWFARRQDPDRRAGANRLDQRRAELTVLDDPGQGAFAKVIGGKGNGSASVTMHVHHFHRSKALRRQPLPSAQASEKLRAAGTERVDTRIPVVAATGVVVSGQCAALQQCHTEPFTTERRRKRQSDGTRAEDDDVVISIGCRHCG